MKKILALLLSVVFAACSTTTKPDRPERMMVKRTALSEPTLGVGGDSLTQVRFENGTTCGAAHLSPVWYMAEDITTCWDKDGKETYHDTQITSAFTIGIAIIGATAGIAAIVFGKAL